MNNPLSPAPGPHVALSLLPEAPVAGDANHELPAGVHGMGAAQGALVAVGNGLARAALHRDVDLSLGESDDDDILFDAWDGAAEIDADAPDRAGAQSPSASGFAVYDKDFFFDFNEMRADSQEGPGEWVLVDAGPAADELGEAADHASVPARARDAGVDPDADSLHHAPVQRFASVVAMQSPLVQARDEAQVHGQQPQLNSAQDFQAVAQVVVYGMRYVSGALFSIASGIAAPQLRGSAQPQNLDQIGEPASRINPEPKVPDAQVKSKSD
ncbi:MAG: hypothetical protein ABWY08_10260 [Comamonas sp.]